MKRLLKILSLGAIVAVLCALSVSVVFAEKNVTDQRYAFVGNPVGLFCADEEIYVYSEDKLYSFSYDLTKTTETELSGVLKYEKTDGAAAYLTADGVFSVNSDGTNDLIVPGATDFTLSGSVTYAVCGSDVIVRESDDLTVTVPTGKNISSIAKCGQKVYFSVKSDAFGYSDVYEVTPDGFTLAFDCLKNVEYLITGEEIAYYGATKAVNPVNGDCVALPVNAKRVSRLGGAFYSITANGELYKTENGLTSLVFACTGNQPGFYAFPGASYSDYGKLFVADYANDRIAVMDDSVSYIDFARPIALTSDYSGVLYVYGKDGLFSFRADNLSEPPIAFPYSGGKITSMTFGAKGLFVLTDGKAYSYDDGELTFVCNAKKIKAEYFGGQLYYLTDGGIFKEDDDYPLVKGDDIVDFDVAADKSIYCLRKGEISCYSAEGDLIFSEKTDENATAFTLSVLSNAYTDFGDLVVTCRQTHRAFNFKPPVASSAPVADLSYTDTGDVIRVTNGDAFIYRSPNSTEKLGKIPSGSTIIVGKYNLYETERMSYVLYEDADGLKEGYVYKGLIGKAKKERAPEFSTARTLYENTALYKFPSAGSVKLLDGVGKNVQVKVLNFADYEANGVKWLKVSYGSQIGYMARDMLATNTVNPSDERPQYNADLKKDAYIYDVVGGEYVNTGNVLKSGTSVEIVGIFDQNTKYTKVRYFDNEKGIRECFVPTETLVSYSVTPLQVIGLIGVGVIVILLVCVLVIRFAAKRKRMLSASGRNDKPRS